MSNYLTTDGLKKLSLLPEAPLRREARGICHICHVVNSVLSPSLSPTDRQTHTPQYSEDAVLMAVMAKAERADTADAGEIKETSTTATLAVPADGVVVTTSVIGPTAARRQQRQRPDCACTTHKHTSSTQPCIPPGSLDRLPASAGARAGMSPLPGGR